MPAEDLFCKVFTVSPLATIISSIPDGRILHANNAFSRLSGLDQDTLSGMTLTSLSIWTCPSEIDHAIQTLISSGTRQERRLKLHKPSGDIIECLFTSQLVSLESDSYILSGCFDITEQNKAEEQVKRCENTLQAVEKRHMLSLARIGDDLSREITGRLETEQKLQENESFIRELLNAPTDTFIVINAEGIIHYINQVAARRYNKSPEEMIGMCIWDMISRDLSGHRKEYIQKVIDTGKAIRFEDEREGVWYDNVFYPIHGTSEGITYIAILARNISERIRAEQAVQESREWIDLALGGADLGLWDWDVKADIFTSSQRYAEILGYSPDEIPGKLREWQKLVHPDDRNNTLRALREHLAGKRPAFEVEFRARTRSGHWKNVLGKGKIMRWDVDGNPERMAGTLLDISEVKDTQEQLRNTTEQLTVLLDSLPIVAYTRRSLGDWGVLYVGKNIQDITGYTADQFSSSPTFWLDHLHPDERENIFKELSIVRDQETQWFEYRFKIADGSYKWLRNLRRIFKNPDGTISHIVGTWQDIDKEVKMRQESEQRLQQIIQADKLASLGEVVAGVAHEINNPNSFISYNIPLLEDTWNIFRKLVEKYLQGHQDWQHDGMSARELFQDMDDIIEAIRTGSDRINRVVNNLKDFTSMDNTNTVKQVEINEVIKKALSIVGAQVRKSVETIRINLAAGLPPIQGQFQKLEQVVTNLIVNALHAIPSRYNGVLSIRSCFVERLCSVIIEVEDNGCGIPSELLDRIFDPFFTTRRSEGGTGLGLSVSYTLVKEHSGRIGVLSRKGIGSRFSVIIPVKTDNPLYLRASILCIEDDRKLQKELQAYLPNVSFLSSDQAGRPEFTVRYIEDHPETDIVICNIPCADHANRTLIEHIANRFPLLAVVIYSCDIEAVKQAMDPTPACCYFIRKPLNILELQKTISSIGRQKL